MFTDGIVLRRVVVGWSAVVHDLVSVHSRDEVEHNERH